MTASWRLEGDYFESCSCEFLCPCLLSHAQAEPTDGWCRGMLAFHVEQGECDDVSLAGANAAILFEAEGPMANGGWTTGLYLDQRLSEAQLTALRSVFSGDLGGAPSVIAAVTGTSLPERTVPMTYEIDGNVRRFDIPGMVDLRVEAVVGGDGKPSWFDNVVHPVAERLAAARGTHATITDHGYDWDNTNRNGHFAPFLWKG